MKIFGPVLLLAACILAGCESPSKTQRASAATTMRRYGCVSCHTIPGIAGAHATVGPPLDRFGGRTYIAGTLQNTPENLAFWLQHPQQVHQGTAMPEMHVTPADAKAMALYLETLH